MSYTPNPKMIVEIAKAVEIEDEVDWSEIHVDKDGIYELTALSLCEKYNDWKTSPNKDTIMLATITKLVVENFALNLVVNKY